MIFYVILAIGVLTGAVILLKGKIPRLSLPNFTMPENAAWPGKAVKLSLFLLLPFILIYVVIDWSANPVGKLVANVVPGIGPGAEELIPFLLWWLPILGAIAYAIVFFFKKPVAADAKSGNKEGGIRYIILALMLAAVSIYLGMRIQEEEAPGVVKVGSEVEFNLKGGKGTREEKVVEPNDIMIVASIRHPRADGQSIYLPCGRIIGPQVVLDNSRLPTRLFVNTTEDGKFFNRIVFSPEAKRVFAGGVAQLRVQWYIIETTRNQASTACRHIAW
jgi:hypothetical protein